MVKLGSFFVFIAAFIGTWFLVTSQNKISVGTHAGIQSKFMILIEESVKAAKPNSSDFQILNIYTEKIDDNQIGAHFSYKYTDKMENNEKVNQVMTGDAVLYRSLSENQKDDKWIIKSIKTDSNIEFQQGLSVNPNSTSAVEKSDKPDKTVTPAEEKKTE